MSYHDRAEERASKDILYEEVGGGVLLLPRPGNSNAPTSNIVESGSSANVPRVVRREETVMGKRSASEFASSIGFLGGPTVKVLVGEEERVYTISRDFLTRSSGYFGGCLHGDTWKEGREGVVPLPEEDLTTFDYILQFIATGADVVLNETDPTITEEIEIARIQLTAYLRTLTLASYLQVEPSPGPQITHNMYNIIQKFRDCVVITGSMIEEAWLLPKKHPVHELFLESCVMDCLRAALGGEGEEEFAFSGELEKVQGFSDEFFPYVVQYVYANARSHSDLLYSHYRAIPQYYYGDSPSCDARPRGILDTMSGEMKHFPRKNWKGTR